MPATIFPLNCSASFDCSDSEPAYQLGGLDEENDSTDDVDDHRDYSMANIVIVFCYSKLEDMLARLTNLPFNGVRGRFEVLQVASSFISQTKIFFKCFK